MSRAALAALAALGACTSALGRSRVAVGREAALEGDWSRSLAPAPGVKKTPVQRVVGLLEKMKAQLQAEADGEAAMYDKMVCWCETGSKGKNQAIAEADAKILALGSEVESRSANFGKLSAEITHLKSQIAEDTKALEQAQSLRERGAEGFRAREKILVQAITNLRNAIAVLDKHQGGSLLQFGTPLVSGLQVLLRDLATRRELLAAGAARPSLLAISTDQEQGINHVLFDSLDVHGAAVPELPPRFAEAVVSSAAEAATKSAAPAAFLQASQQGPVWAGWKSYNPRSSGIFGVLEQMLEDFQSELKDIQATEATEGQAHAELAETKGEQVELGKEKLDALEEEDASNQKALADANEDLDMTRKQRSADVKFLQNLQGTCNDLDKNWERRSATRSEEIKAVTEAISILTQDDNRETLVRSVTLLQEGASARASATAARRARAAAALRSLAREPGLDDDDLLADWHGRHGQALAARPAGEHRARLSALAAAVQLNGFMKVKEMMDRMVEELKQQQASDVKLKAYCTKELGQNKKATYTKTQEKKDLEMKIDALTTAQTDLAREIADAKAQIAETDVEIKTASQSREQENSEFQTTLADQRATQAILKKAMLRLRDFYGRGQEGGPGPAGPPGPTSLLQRQTPPAQFGAYKANAASTPVMGLLEQIIEDSKRLEAEATQSESKAQADYQQFVKESNALIAQLAKGVTVKTKVSAATKMEKAETKSNHQDSIDMLESLNAYEADLHAQCDWSLRNFGIRQKARLQEIEAIQGAKAILSGAAAPAAA
mmetsp:Transcript_70421/g.199684  ORF Transcript_70421/g.199684 Transcript_70421/m.199684 type:complete len:783 (+) Transcript_70421:77-2425(+)|eukprot:CAMPEP_0168380362 /NCGR_PEP_ID=MMETSP0228-20121227/12320_1 /TAXON_ID=133427 /ORGANISM="Protoceratium reticulatum, Strain CCCM 535 (=CCMP 1889)" /LENGTH=782 /DNA_ID=CAMNT_0008393423 /DNA_START=65 /DNA_END=2413 /DNA_ORIENTATION=+